MAVWPRDGDGCDQRRALLAEIQKASKVSAQDRPSSGRCHRVPGCLVRLLTDLLLNRSLNYRALGSPRGGGGGEWKKTQGRTQKSKSKDNKEQMRAVGGEGV